MKQLFLFLSSSLCMLNLYATVKTVSNYPSTLAQYNTIQAAVDAASSGDTIYVHGSPINYAGFKITDKRLTILGPGWAPEKNFLPFKATVDQMTTEGLNCAGTEIQGLEITGSISINTAAANLRFVRNHLKGSMQMGQYLATYKGYVFEGNWFDNANINGSVYTTYENILFKNNIFYMSYWSNSIYGFTNCINVIFDHNLWYAPPATPYNCFNSDCRTLTITNNLFVNRDAGKNNSYSTFNNNITYNAGTNNPWSINSNTDAGGNVANQNPQMATQDSVDAGRNNPLLDFTIAAGPANNSGTDGKDMGLLFDGTGSLNWVNSRLSRLPFIYSMSIANPTIAAGGTLNITVEARKSN